MGRRAVGRAMAALVAAVLWLPVGPVPAFAAPRLDLAADDPVGAALALSRAAFPDGAPRALLGRSDDFPDSLAAGVLQDEAPLLLTPAATFDERVAGELARLGVEEVVLLGGQSALSTVVEQAVAKAGHEVRRVAGSGRVETAVEIAKLRPGARRVLLARSGAPEGEGARGFVDALAAGAWAAESGLPVLLSDSAALSAATATYLDAAPVDEITLVGGRAALSDAVAAQAAALGATVTRVAGVDRFETAAEVAEARGLRRGAPAVLVVDGERSDAFAPGFAAAALAARERAPVLLARSSGALPDATRRILRASREAAVWCGPFTAAGPCAEAGGLARAEAPELGEWADSSASDLALAAPAGDAAAARREFTLSASGGPFTLALVDPSAVQGWGDDARFPDADGDGRADGLDAAGAVIESVRGRRVAAAATVPGVLADDGAIVAGVRATSINAAARLLVFQDLDGDGALAVDEAGAASEPATVSGAAVWVPADAGPGASADQRVAQAWPGLDLFSSDTATYRWVAADTYAYTSGQSSALTITAAEFEAMLSQGDTVAVSTTATGRRFTITRDVPAAPADLRALPADLDGDGRADTVRVTWQRPPNVDLAPGVAYEVERTTRGELGYVPWASASRVTGPGTLRTDLANVADGVHRFRVVAFNRVGDRSPGSWHDTVTVGGEPPAAPILRTARVVRGAGQADSNVVLDAGDTIELTFGGPVEVAAAAWIELRDADGTLVRLTRGVNAAMTAAAADASMLIVAVAGPPEVRVGSVGDGALSVAGLAAVAASEGIGNVTGSWNLPDSGRADAASRTRVVSGALNALPEAIAAAHVTANAAVDRVSLAAGANGVATGDTVTLYNRLGMALASGTYDAAAGLTLTAAPGFSAGERLLLVYVDESAKRLPSRTTTLQAPDPAPVPTRVSGGGSAITLFFGEPVTALATGAVEIWDSADLRKLGRATAITQGDGDAVALTLDVALVTGTTYRVHVGAGIARDADGVNNGDVSLVFTASAAIPTIAITAGPAHTDQVATSTVTWSGTAADSDGVVTAVRHRLDGGAWTSTGVTADTPGASVSWSLSLTLSEGVHTVEFQAVEHGGGTSAMLTRQITTNAFAPIMTDAVAVNGAPEIIVTFSEPVTCPNAGANAWVFDENDDNVGQITAQSVDAAGLGANQCRVVFAPPAFTATTDGRLDYGAPAGANRVLDTGGTALAPNSSISVRAPG